MTAVGCGHAQQRKGEYSPFKIAPRLLPRPRRISAQQRKGEYSPFKAMAPGCVQWAGSAQQRKGEYSPFKPPLRVHRPHLRLRSTKEGGIFPLQAVRVGCRAFRGLSLNKGRGNIPPSSKPSIQQFRVQPNAQQRKGEYSPFKAEAPPAMNRTRRNAQQRKGEYSPFKCRRAAQRTA